MVWCEAGLARRAPGAHRKTTFNRISLGLGEYVLSWVHGGPLVATVVSGTKVQEYAAILAG